MPTKFVTNPRRPAAKRNPRASSGPSADQLRAVGRYVKMVDPEQVALARRAGMGTSDAALGKYAFRIYGSDPERWEELCAAAEGRDNPRRKNPDAATPRVFLMVLRSKLTQHDARLSAKQPNLYRLGHYLAAAERVEKDMGRSLDSTTPAALEKMRRSLHERFTMPFAPASAVERQIDAYLASGTMPSLVRKNPGHALRRNDARTTSNYLRDLRPAQVAQMVREGALAITHADIGNDYHTVTLFEDGAGENRKQVEAKWFVPGDEWYALSLGLRDGKVDPATADLFLGPSRWDKREREEQTRAAAKHKGITIDASRHYFNNPRRPAAKRNPRRKNPPKGFRIAGPAVKTMSEGLRISKADAQRLKEMMDTGAPRILQAADKVMNGHGVERISGVGGGLMYVNMGDTYDTTLIYDYKTNRFVVSSWGDIVERQPRRFAD